MKVANVLIVLTCLFAGSISAQEDANWRDGWDLAPGFVMETHSSGYRFPSAMAVVPSPGERPEDPLYFVTELRGKIKVVCRDGSISTFADVSELFNLTPEEELPNGKGQAGMAGICLEPERGYVFVTTTTWKEDGTIHHNIIRYQSEPRTFSTSPRSHVAFTEIFEDYPGGITHQIGGPAIDGETLLVGVGDGWQPYRTQMVDDPAGKVLRMTLDGKPLPDNPFYMDDDVRKIRNYVWAYGLRNPFSLTTSEGRIFVADNGPDVDRFVEIEKGRNYHWNGQQTSIQTDASFLWVPAESPMQLARCPVDFAAFPEQFRGVFFCGLHGLGGIREREGENAGIFLLPYNLDKRRMSAVPGYFLRNLTAKGGRVTAMAFGPDALYFGVFSHFTSEGAIYRISYEPANELAQVEAGYLPDPYQFMKSKGCFACHSMSGAYGFGGTVGPPLVTGPEMLNRLSEKLNDPDYLASLDSARILESAGQFSVAEARAEVKAAQGADRVRTWLKYYLQEPSFDRDTVIPMPALGLTEKEALHIADYLVRVPPPKPFLKRVVASVLPAKPRHRHLVLFFAGGILCGMAGVVAAGFLVPKVRSGARTEKSQPLR